MNLHENTTGQPDSKPDFFLGPHLVQPGRNAIHGPNGEIRVEPLAMQVLVCLSEAGGATVSRETLNLRVWDGRVVSDKVLTRAISNLRKALGDRPHRPQFIETIAKSGYRLSVRAISAGPAQGRQPQSRIPVKTTTSGPRSGRRTATLLLSGTVLFAAIAGTWILREMGKREPKPALLANLPATPVTSYPGHELRPRLSPNGDRIAFAWKGPSGDNWDLYIQHVNNGEPFRLTTHPDADLSPAWAPDGSRVAFLRFAEKTCGIYIQPVPGGQEQKLRDYFRIPIEQIGFASPKLEWTPNGNGIAFPDIQDGKGPLRIVLFSLEDGGTTTLTHPEAGTVGDLDPAFSPDGRFLAVTRVRTWADQDLVVIDRKNGEERQITHEGRIILGHDWRTDGKRLVFSSNRAGNYWLWEVGATGGPPAWISTAGQQLKYPNLARKDEILVFENWQYDTNIWHFPAKESENEPPRMEIASTHWDFHPDYNAHRQRFAFISNRSGSFEVWQCDREGKTPLKLTSLAGALPGGPRWSPQGDAIAFHAFRNGRADLFLWREGMGPAKPVMETETDELFPEWSADGLSLFFTSNRAGSWQLHKMRVEGDDETVLATGGAFFCRTAKNGECLVFTQFGGNRVWLLALADGTPQPLFSLDSQGDWGNLAVVDRGIFFIKRDPDFSASLAFYDFGSKSVAELRPLSNKIPFHEPGMTAPPDGAWISISQIDQTENDIFLSHLQTK